MRFTLFALTFAGLSCNVIAGGEPTFGFRNHPLTVDEAVQLALKQNPSILQQVQQLKVEKGLFYQAQARLLPQLTANSNSSQTDSALRSVSSGGASNINLLGVPAGGPGAGTLSVNSFGAGQPPHNA